MNPLFVDDPSSTPPGRQDGYVLPRQDRRVEPLQNGSTGQTADPAVEFIRRKIDALYESEPDAQKELSEVEDMPVRSKHQQKMYELSTSGRSLAEIQTAWHEYYASLPDAEKRQVWQEFYSTNNQRQSEYTQYAMQHRPGQHQAQQPANAGHAAAHSGAAGHEPQTIKPEHSHAAHHTPAHHAVEPEKPKAFVSDHELLPYTPYTPTDKRSMKTIKKQVLRKVQLSATHQEKAKQHFQSLLFGLGTGSIVLLVVLFGLFNNLIIAPFIRPGGNADATPIILSTDGIAPTDQNQVIIPKINVELPYLTGNGTSEEAIQEALNEGVVRYPTTAEPGQKGNVAVFGHSSNNIFNKGKYKFAFVLLHELVPGDIFYMTNNGKVFTYKVYDKKIVNPEDTWVLNPVQDKTATAVLITCDPPGTTLHRLVVWGEQVSPDPNGNAAPTATPAVETPTELPNDGPSLWSRIWNGITPW